MLFGQILHHKTSISWLKSLCMVYKIHTYTHTAICCSQIPYLKARKKQQNPQLALIMLGISLQVNV